MLKLKRTDPKAKKVRIAVNVMRARLTVLGFNLAVISILMTNSSVLSGGYRLEGFEIPIHVTVSVPLFLALGLAIVALILFIASSEMDETGIVSHWAMPLGEIAMYLSLAQTVTGFFGPYLMVLDTLQLATGAEQADFLQLRHTLAAIGAIAWLGAFYLGPIVTLIRSPFSNLTTAFLGITYVSLCVLIAWTTTLAYDLDVHLHAGLETPVPWSKGLLMPLLW
ncbi:hypothetical protein [Shimia haliotis]|uniref:hypothetical protein n=1 Tax=Shimia haliotis TaxID=1280847 RepID=UPI0011141BC4|nr:hypothetical protein [Shimia haliotis]